MLRWYTEQSERLGVPVPEIEDAIMRGWGGHEIAALPSACAAELAGPPRADAEHKAAVARIRDAPVMPLHLGYETRRRLRSGHR